MQTKYKYPGICVLGFLAVLAGIDAHAETTAAELLRLGEETAVLKARAKLLEAQRQVSSMQSQPGRATADAPVFTPGLPSVQSIEGIGGALYATLQPEQGGTLDVKAGDMVGKNLKIIDVKPREVIVQSGKNPPVSLRVNSAVGVADAASPPPKPPAVPFLPNEIPAQAGSPYAGMNMPGLPRPPGNPGLGR
jgi:type IV pilus biogenesis protein PilP